MFLTAHTPLFLYPFLHTSSKTRPFEYLRLTSLGVIGALVKSDEQEVITFLLTTEIIPLCLRIMECGSELSKTVATFILQKILLDDSGLSYICQTYDRFSHVAIILVSCLFWFLSAFSNNGWNFRGRWWYHLPKSHRRAYLSMSSAAIFVYLTMLEPVKPWDVAFQTSSATPLLTSACKKIVQLSTGWISWLKILKPATTNQSKYHL